MANTFHKCGKGLVCKKKQENERVLNCRAYLITATVLALILFNSTLHFCSHCHVNIIDMTAKGDLGLLEWQEFLLTKSPKGKPNLLHLTLGMDEM